MSILYVLIPLSLLLMAGAAWALFWAIDNEQFDDLDDASRSVCERDDTAPGYESPARAAATAADTL